MFSFIAMKLKTVFYGSMMELQLFLWRWILERSLQRKSFAKKAKSSTWSRSEECCFMEKQMRVCFCWGSEFWVLSGEVKRLCCLRRQVNEAVWLNFLWKYRAARHFGKITYKNKFYNRIFILIELLIYNFHNTGTKMREHPNVTTLKTLTS